MPNLEVFGFSLSLTAREKNKRSPLSQLPEKLPEKDKGYPQKHKQPSHHRRRGMPRYPRRG